MKLSLIHETVELIDRAMAHWIPHKLFVAYSGGKDSAVALDIVNRLKYKRYVGAMSIDTGISADGWLDMVSSHCAGLGVSLDIVRGGGFEWYEKNVKNYGFGYTEGHHTVYYRMLKQEAIRKHLKSVKGARRDRIVYVTGVRRSESAKRANTPLWYRSGSRITLNPLMHWGSDDVNQYLAHVAKWWNSPFYETVGTSGDCLCGWTCRQPAQHIKSVHPLIGGKLVDLENKVLADGLWRYDERPKKSQQLPSDDMPNDSLCANCGK